jgi:hypothetical protein
MLDKGTTVHAHDDDLELYVRGRLEAGHVSNLESHLLECRVCRERLSDCIGLLPLKLNPTGKKTSPQEKGRRSEVRFSSGDRAIFQELNPLSVERQEVKIVDVSKNGLGILAPRSVLPGTIVQVRIRDDVEIGEVRYCSASGDQGYRIGLRLHKPF